VRLLLEAIGPGGPAPCRRELLPARLVVRESCGGKRQPAPLAPALGTGGVAGGIGR